MTESADPHAELHDLDERIAELTRSIDEINASMTDSGAVEPEELAAALTNREELEGVLDGLRSRRETVRGQVEQA